VKPLNDNLIFTDMRTKLIVYTLFLSIVIMLLNCKGSQGDPGPAGASGSILSGSINGVLTLTNANGTQPTDLSGVTVKTNKGDSTVTNTSGSWTLNEITGVYTLTFTKSGYGTNTVFGYNFPGGGSSYLNTVALNQAPVYTTSVTLDSIAGNSTATKDLHMNVNLTIAGMVGQTADMEFFIYYSTNSSVSASNYMGMINAAVSASQTTYKGSITGADFLSAGITTGQVVYVVVYPAATTPTLSSKYVNETTGKTVYTALGQPSVVENLPVPH
jgi:hypothetical protein